MWEGGGKLPRFPLATLLTHGPQQSAHGTVEAAAPLAASGPTSVDGTDHPDGRAAPLEATDDASDTRTTGAPTAVTSDVMTR